MGDGYPHTSSLVMLAFQKTRKIIAWNNPTWFEKTLLHFEQQIRFILNPNIEDSPDEYHQYRHQYGHIGKIFRTKGF